MTDRMSFVLEMAPCRLNLSDDGWKDIVPQHIETWQLASTILAERVYYVKGAVVHVEVDWSSAIRSYQHFYHVQREVEAELTSKPPKYEALKKYRKKALKIPVRTTVKNGKKEDYYHLALTFLHDAFLILNLSSPGCCNFDSAKFKDANAHGLRHREEIRLSNYRFESSMLFKVDGMWPSLDTIRLDAVAKWYFSIRQEFSQLPKTSTEKVLFALMHIAKEEISPTTIVWIFYSLEQLFNTRPGENRKALESRLRLLLCQSEKENSVLRKKLNALYDYRSSVVHGGLEIIHVMHNEALDQRIEKAQYQLMDNADFGFSLIIASIQKLIVHGSSSFSFTEILDYKKL